MPLVCGVIRAGVKRADKVLSLYFVYILHNVLSANYTAMHYLHFLKIEYFHQFSKKEKESVALENYFLFKEEKSSPLSTQITYWCYSRLTPEQRPRWKKGRENVLLPVLYTQKQPETQILRYLNTTIILYLGSKRMWNSDMNHFLHWNRR